MSDELITWLRAQLDEDERQAGIALGRGTPAAQQLARFLLADVQAKRQIFDHASDWAATLHHTPEGWTPQTTTPYRMAMEWTVQHLALAYADRDGYRQEWRP